MLLFIPINIDSIYTILQIESFQYSFMVALLISLEIDCRHIVTDCRILSGPGPLHFCPTISHKMYHSDPHNSHRGAKLVST